MKNLRAATILCTLTCCITIAQQVAGKAARDALFLAHYDSNTLPRMMIAAAVVSLGAVVGMSRALAVYGPRKIVPVTFGLSGLLFVAEYFLAQRAPAAAALSLFLHVAVFGSTSISAFWSLVNEHFDPHSAKQVVGTIAGGGTFGGIVGGVVAWRFSQAFPVIYLLLVLAGMCALSAVVVLRLGPSASEQSLLPAPSTDESALQIIRQAPYLRQLAALVCLIAASDALLDVALSSQVKARYVGGSGLMAFFSVYHMTVGLLAFLLQTVASRRILASVGLAGAAASLPLTILGLGGVGFFARGFTTVVGLRAGAAVVKNSLYRSGYELFYTPLSPAKKRPTKTLIDVGMDRLGTALGSGLSVGLVALFPALLEPLLVGLAVGCAALALVLTGALRKGYVKALEASLKSGALALDITEVGDATTRRTLTETSSAIDRERLLSEIEALRKRSAAQKALAEADVADTDGAAEDLAEGDRAREEQALKGGTNTPETPQSSGRQGAKVALGQPAQQLELLLVRRGKELAELLGRPGQLSPYHLPALIDLLGDNRWAAPAAKALRVHRERHVGMLIDALLDTDKPAAVRRRLPRIIEHVASERAGRALLAVVRLPKSFEIRHAASQSLVAFARRQKDLRPGVEEIKAAALGVAGELAGSGGAIVAGPTLDKFQCADLIVDLLSVHYPAESLQLARAGLQHSDAGMQGTALEYLETALPAELRSIWSKLFPEQGEKRRSSGRSTRKLLQALEGGLGDVNTTMASKLAVYYQTFIQRYLKQILAPQYAGSQELRFLKDSVDISKVIMGLARIEPRALLFEPSLA